MATAAVDCCRAPAGTIVEIEIAQPLSSGQQKRGDRFPIRLHAPLRAGQSVLIPAGVEGIGEVVHAEPSRGGGKPGEMLLAARYLEHDGRQVLLRAFKLGGRGGDNSGAALGASFAIGPFALFIHGNEIEIPAGTIATAKLAQDVAATGAEGLGSPAPVPTAPHPLPALADESPKE